MTKIKKEHVFKIGEIAHLPVDGLMVEVQIIEDKSSYGRQRYLIVPTRGTGEAVVEKLVPRENE